MAVWYGELQSCFPRKLCINQNVIWVIFNGLLNKESCGGGHRCKYSYYIVTSCHIFHKNYKLVKNINEGSITEQYGDHKRKFLDFPLIFV